MNRRTGETKKWNNLLENFFIVILAFYPLRHISWGLDLWDTGYNYANFQYMGLEHMDPMWLFSTYLANVTGHFLTKLPGAGTLVGMNLYTGLFAGALALAGYFFCTRSLKIPSWIAFLGELLALSLCWCPTALLYNYLTYLLFLAGACLLYLGLTREKNKLLLAAGACLGVNVLVRFSNLPEAALILAVWAYDVILWLEGRKARPKDWGRDGRGGFFRRLLSHTGWCVLGYAGALGILLLWIWVRYGLDTYAAGILRLFDMTDTATDYQASSMVVNMLRVYAENLYWVLRIGVIAAGGLLFFAAADGLERLLNKREALKPAGRAVHIAARALWAGVSCAMLGWLYYRGFCSLKFYSYDSMLRPGVLFLMLTVLIAAVRILRPDSPEGEKLIAGMLILIIFLTALGSNNKVFPSLNNLFLAAPYTLWQSFRFLTKVKETAIKLTPPGKQTEGRPVRKISVDPFPLKGLLAAFLAMCLLQFGGFGAGFAFAEATGVQNVTASVENNPILRGAKMNPEKARWMTEISAFVSENDLQGREVILYGRIPSLSYYLQLPSAFNPWSDLESYGSTVMADKLSRLAMAVSAGKEDAPVIILEIDYVRYLEGGEDALDAAGVSAEKQAEILKATNGAKLPLLSEFMRELNYVKVFENEKFVIYDLP